MESSEVMDERVGFDGSMLSGSNCKERDIAGDDSAFYEKFILDDLESYWDELNDRLSVLRMVSDSVTKGMVTAVVEEAAEKIASKEAEIAMLNNRLHSHKYDKDIDSRLGMSAAVSAMDVDTEKPVLQLRQGFLDAGLELSYNQHLSRFRVAVEDQLQRIKEDFKYLTGTNSRDPLNASSEKIGDLTKVKSNGKLPEIDERVDALRELLASGFEQISDMFNLAKVLVLEHKLEQELQKEVGSLMIQNYIRCLKDEFEMKLYEQRGLINTLNKNWQDKIAELTAMREELDAISKSLLVLEPGMLLSHISHECFEEQNSTKRKDHISGKVLGEHATQSQGEENGILVVQKSRNSGEVMLDIADISHLKHMSMEEMVTYFKSEMIKMRRQHDMALQEKTEELFRLKREFLREKGSLPFRKDKEFESVRKKITEVISKLDHILVKNVNFHVTNSDRDEISRLKDRVDYLFYENQHLRGLLLSKRNEVKHLSSQISDARSKMSLHSSSEANFLKQIGKLDDELEELKVKVDIKDVIHYKILRETVGKYQCCMEDINIQTSVLQETCSIIFKGIVCDAISAVGSTVQKYYVEKASLKEMLLEKEKVLILGNEENQKLKQALASLSALISEKEQFASDAGSTFMQQKEQLDIVHNELNMLRDQLAKQTIIISDFERESDSMKSKLDDTSQQIYQYEVEISKLKQNLMSTSNALEELENQNILLCGIIEEKQKTSSSSIKMDNEQEKQLKCIRKCVDEMSKGFLDFENKLVETIRRNENRLNALNSQHNPLVQQAILLKRKGLWYKQMLEMRCSDLQKAEAEVDLLGDEVDALLSLLGKIYIALDHYSPVLQHYPGVMEILNLVQRELKGETARKVW
ncbi:WPP domain-associated protein-like [Typha latifolia]|uniref:WPP domain-associated protein-like n=1 Tax=Typha latifolia TaxID=4733 RepID=UPI003C300727